MLFEIQGKWKWLDHCSHLIQKLVDSITGQPSCSGIFSQNNIDMLPCSSGYSATIRTGVLGRTGDLDCPIKTISENKRFLAKWTNKVENSAMQPLKTLKPFDLTWPLWKQPSNLWILFLRLPKNWLIIFFSEIVLIGQSFPNSGKLRHGPPKIQSKSDGEWSISEHLTIRKMRLCQMVTCVVSVNMFFVF